MESGGEGRSGVLSSILTRERALLMAGVLVMEMVIFFGAMVVPVSQSTQQALKDAAKHLQNATAGASPLDTLEVIFFNNVRLALAEMVPVLGAIVFFVSITTTGQVIQVVATSYGAPGPLVGGLLFVFPFTMVELSAYALAVGSGSMLLVAWRRRILHGEVKVFALEAVGVVLVLLAAAAMETAALISPSLGLALWLPTALLIGWLAVRLGRPRR